MNTLKQRVDAAREEIISEGLYPEENKFYVERVSAFDAQDNHIYTVNVITGKKTFFSDMPPIVDTKYYDMNTEVFGHWAGEEA